MTAMQVAHLAFIIASGDRNIKGPRDVQQFK